jgi:hypothetical protein
MRIQTYREFWPYYLSEHSRPWTKRLHSAGTLLGIAVGIYLGVTQGLPYALFGLVVAYGFAWTSHFLIEKNQPATFHYPIWSFFSDFRMLYCLFRGRF